MESVQSAMDSLVDGGGDVKDDAARATVLAGLRADLSKFGKDMLEHLDREEHSFATPIARKVGGGGGVCACVVPPPPPVALFSSSFRTVRNLEGVQIISPPAFGPTWYLSALEFVHAWRSAIS